MQQALRDQLASDSSAGGGNRGSRRSLALHPPSPREILAAADSGCTGSLTWNERWLINKRACDETFRSATGTIATCSSIGDMPVVALSRDGTLICCLLRNVRCIPEFKYTLLSVNQLWRDQGYVALDDSDPCVFTKELPDGEVVTIGLYVDNLQIVHSVELDSKGRGPRGCEYNRFMDALASDWSVTDEGPMDDLLGIEIQRNKNGSITLHQRKYIEKLVARFLPHGPSNRVQNNSMPYSQDFSQHIANALAQEGDCHPELVRKLQERVGSLMYACTSTRPDIAYPVHQLCKCLQKPTPELIEEADRVLSYLSRHSSVGLTYTKAEAALSGYADASWETRNSTSGWVILWQGAALTWGSRKQKCTALSTCEAEIIALSEATKDVVYLRKLLTGVREAPAKPTLLYTDSKSARDVSYNPEHHDKMKHVARRHFFVRDMVEEFEIEVPYVKTTENIADFFTKQMKCNKVFFEFRRIIMNERFD